MHFFRQKFGNINYFSYICAQQKQKNLKYTLGFLSLSFFIKYTLVHETH